MARLCYRLTRFEVSSSFIISAGGPRKIARLKRAKRVGRAVGFL
jgi:hypothetical protein